MTTKKADAATQGVGTSKNGKNADGLVNGWDFEELTSLVNSRTVLKRHRDKLNTLKQKPDFVEELKGNVESNEKPLSGIQLSFGNYEKYVIENAVLVNEVTEFLIARFDAKLNEVESDISSIQG